MLVKRPKKPPKKWVYSPPNPPKPKVPDHLKAEVTEKADQLIEEWKPQHIKKPPKGHQWNYIVDLYTRWFRSYFYFCARYACPGPTAISPFFEARFTRMEYIGERRFNLAYMRHTGKWVATERGLAVNECMEAIRRDEFYHP